MGYKVIAIRGLTWMGTLRVVTRLTAFIKIAILARILGPTEFGVFGIASLMLAFLEIITETGINAFLIQEKENVRRYLNTAWTVSIIRGILIGLILFGLSTPVAVFFNSPESARILIFVSVIPMVRGFINPAIVTFQKNLQFAKEFNLRIFLYFVDTVVSVILAFILKSAESLVIGMLAATALELLISFRFIKPIPKLRFEKKKLIKVINRGKWITLSGLFDYMYHNGDDIVVGRLLNTFSLGLYQVAYKIGTLPVTEGGEIVSKVVFPVYSKISGNKKRLKTAYIKVLLMLTLTLVPLGLTTYIFAQPLVRIFLGVQWMDMIPALRVLIIYGVIRAISGSTSAVFLALKKQKYIAAITLVSFVGMAITVVPLVLWFGVEGAAWSAVIGAILSVPFMYYFFQKEFKV